VKKVAEMKLNTASKLFALSLGFVLTAGPLVAFGKKEPNSSGGSHAVKGHFKKDGKYVQPHQATNPNQTQKDNWSSKPNVNPYNGKPGTKEAEK
jgi:hypothetical protein